MPVVINEFEVVERSPLQRAGGDEAPAAAEGEAKQRLEPPELWPALRAIAVHALRAWAH